MFEYIEGKIVDLTPTYAVVEANGIGYLVHISLSTYSKLQGKNEIKLLLHQIVREDAHLLYGFSSTAERDIFRLLISVSGIGANTARMILSSMTPDEVQKAIFSGNVNALKSIKGIGLKSAQRIIVDLKDKINKESDADFLLLQDNTIKKEALSALVMLGFAKNTVDKVLNKILADKPTIEVENLVKEALKNL